MTTGNSQTKHVGEMDREEFKKYLYALKALEHARNNYDRIKEEAEEVEERRVVAYHAVRNAEQALGIPA